MANNTIDLGAAITSALSRYSDKVLKDVKVILEEEAEKLVNDIRERAPKRHKKVKGRALNAYSKGWTVKKVNAYSKGWTVKKVKEDNLSAEFVVHNKNQYHLTHLLEKGFATRDGGRIEGNPHIAPAEEEAEQRILERIESAVSDQ